MEQQKTRKLSVANSRSNQSGDMVDIPDRIKKEHIILDECLQQFNETSIGLI
jgi:hypothetical protein